MSLLKSKFTFHYELIITTMGTNSLILRLVFTFHYELIITTGLSVRAFAEK